MRDLGGTDGARVLLCEIVYCAYFRRRSLADDSWRQIRKDALEFIVKHQSRLEPTIDIRELMTRMVTGGPVMVRVLASIEIDVPSEQIPSRFEAELIPFGKAFFLEAGPDWTGSLDLTNAEAMKIVESYRKTR